MSNIEEIIKIVLKAAYNKREGAGYAGERGDRGASILETQVEFYRYGMQGVVPPDWEKYEKKLDPEYETYLKLKRKFED